MVVIVYNKMREMKETKESNISPNIREPKYSSITTSATG